jgi:hypothetical protein
MGQLYSSIFIYSCLKAGIHNGAAVFKYYLFLDPLGLIQIKPTNGTFHMGYFIRSDLPILSSTNDVSNNKLIFN